jgi:glycosyltransferase involved in cell wall biosynthesis
MKVAIIHDVLIELGGAERVLFQLLKMFPEADVFIPLMSANHRETIEAETSGRVQTSLLNRIPFIHSASILVKPWLYLYWELLELSAYDLVISSSHSFSSKSVITSPDTLHVSYIHTPPRYLYTEFNETRVLKHPILRLLLAPLMTWLRTQDFIGAHRPDVLIANSRTVQNRINKYYRLKSSVIYPPIKTTSKKTSKLIERKYFICYSRLAKQKGIELAIQACNFLNLPLVIIGSGSEETYLRSIAGPTITFLGRVPDARLAEVMRGAKAMIYCSREEDFGMAPVEVMAYGVPVIAYRSGGVQESVLEGKTGTFFDEFTVESLSRKLKQFKSNLYSPTACQKQAATFSEAIFTKRLRVLIKKELSHLARRKRG